MIPANGTLRLSGSALANGQTFTHADIVAGLVTYDHDDTENFADSFDFTVDDGAGTATSNTFNWLIAPVNDNSTAAIMDHDSSLDFVAENDSIGTAVGITAFADDLDTGDTISYSLDDNDGGRFTIDGGTGIVSVAGPIDREIDGPTRSYNSARDVDGRFVTNESFQY